MSLREELERKARGKGATLVYPEPEDERIREAAAEVAELEIATPLLVGSSEELPADDSCECHSIEDSDHLEEFAEVYAEQRDLKLRMARRLVRRPLVFAGMMVGCGYADGMVAGIANATASVLTAAGLAIGYREGISSPSSAFLIVVPRIGDQSDVPLVFADCAVNINPTGEELTGIALASAETARRFLQTTPRVAMLSFSSDGSASDESVDRVREAGRRAAERIENGYVDGEFQLDTALVPAVAERKVKRPSEVAGQANVLIFPDLNAGNIAYKATQYLGGAEAIGPVLQGFDKPVNDLSRGASPADVVTVSAITVLQSL